MMIVLAILVFIVKGDGILARDGIMKWYTSSSRLMVES